MSALFFILLNEKVTIFSHVRRCREDEYLELACLCIKSSHTTSTGESVAASRKKKKQILTRMYSYVFVCHLYVSHVTV